VLVANRDFWKKLPTQVRLALVEQARSLAERVNNDAVESEQSAIVALKERDFQAPSITAAERAAFVDSALPSWRSVKALSNDALLDTALALLGEYRGGKLPQRRTDSPPSSEIRLATDRSSSDGGPTTVLFATDRHDLRKTDSSLYFGGERDNLSFGAARIAIGGDRRFATAVQLEGLNDLTAEGFFDAIKAAVIRRTELNTFVYVHGFRTSFKTALESAAQIATDIGFRGPIVVFSWPSDNSVFSYLNDAEEVDGSRGNFDKVIKLLASVDERLRIHILTHSMGGRLVTKHFERPDPTPTGAGSKVFHLILAAPDVRVSNFDNALEGMQKQSKRLSLYASQYDQALLCSQWANRGPRAGQGGDDRVVRKDLDTIDASNVERGTWYERLVAYACTPYGHGYISQNPAVLADLYELLTYNTAPTGRQRLRPRLSRVGPDLLSYFEFR
jgi:esterase/lipase superfamily enzyme